MYSHRVHPTMRCIGCEKKLHVAPLTGYAAICGPTFGDWDSHALGASRFKRTQNVVVWGANGKLHEHIDFLNPHLDGCIDFCKDWTPTKDLPMPFCTNETNPLGACWTCQKLRRSFKWQHTVEHHVQCMTCCMRYCSSGCLEKNQHDAVTCTGQRRKSDGLLTPEPKRQRVWEDFKCVGGVAVVDHN